MANTIVEVDRAAAREEMFVIIEALNLNIKDHVTLVDAIKHHVLSEVHHAVRELTDRIKRPVGAADAVDDEVGKLSAALDASIATNAQTMATMDAAVERVQEEVSTDNPCPICHGTGIGSHSGSDKSDCDECGGSGYYPNEDNDPETHHNTPAKAERAQDAAERLHGAQEDR